MSFSSEVKEELSRITNETEHCMIAELAAILSVCGQVSIGEDDAYGLLVRTENVAVARKYFTLLKKTFNIDARTVIRKNSYLKKNALYRVEVKVHEEAVRVLQSTGFMMQDMEICENLMGIHQGIVHQECCKKAFLRGVFLATGSISDPEKSYHLEWICKTKEDAEGIVQLSKRFEIHGRITERKGRFVVYLKDSTEIVDMLNVLGAHKSLMEMENVRILTSPD